MLADQRRREILNELSRTGSAETLRLSERYEVSEMTIRRDLRQLEQENLVRCTHGGAIFLGSPSVQEMVYSSKEKLHSGEKAGIARYAALELVGDRDVIILDPGTTAAGMVSHLRGKRELTVVSNSLPTTNALQSLLPESTVLCTGGILRQASLTFIGPSAEGFFAGFNARKFFLSAIGCSLEKGLTDPQNLDTQVKQAMIRSAQQVIVLVDSSKFGVVSTYAVMQLAEADILVTDAGAPPGILEQLRERGVDVRIVPGS
jgi:DeoR/GlpR family transcriptional regulator of sugar metabolism